jgi:hypothetical protein
MAATHGGAAHPRCRSARQGRFMSNAQRNWLSGFLLMLALVLATRNLEWDSQKTTAENETRRILVFYETSILSAPDYDVNLPQWMKGSRAVHIYRHGIYIRQSIPVNDGFNFGVVVPLLLIGVAGFTGLGHRRTTVAR